MYDEHSKQHATGTCTTPLWPKECIPPWHTATQPPIGQDPSHDQDADMLADTQAGQQQQQRQQQQH